MITLNDLVEQFNSGQIEPIQKIVIRDGENSWNIWIKDVADNTELDRYRNREFREIGDTWFLDATVIKFKTLLRVGEDESFIAKENILIRDKSQYPSGEFRITKGAGFSRSAIRDEYMEMIVVQRSEDFLLDVDSLKSI